VRTTQYLGTRVRNQNYIHEQVKDGLNSGNVCCHPVQNPLSSRLLSNNLKVKQSKAVPLHAMQAYWGRGGTAPTHS
jgi:hypothetical protein